MNHRSVFSRKTASVIGPVSTTVATLLLVLLLGPIEGRAYASDARLRSETSRNILNDDPRGEDLAIREVAREALGSAAGTVVVMNARTGRVYTIVNQDWGVRDAFKPCSTIKLVTGVAGYNEDLINEDGSLSRGQYRLGLDAALAYSNNRYFQMVGKHLGSDKMIFYAQLLGLGRETGINIEGEVAGRLPFGNENLRIYSHADDFMVTPLQLAVMVSALTNGGRIVVPRVPRSRSERVSFRGRLRKNLELQPSIYRRVIPGMIGAADYGTARTIPNRFNVAGKTGSCISRGTWVGLFASVAPAQNPEYSVVVITRGKKARGRHSAAIAAKVYEHLEARTRETGNPVLVAENRRPVSSPSESESRRGEIRRTSSSRPSGTNSKSRKSPKAKQQTIEEMFPTIVIVNGKKEISRPRVIKRN